MVQLSVILVLSLSLASGSAPALGADLNELAVDLPVRVENLNRLVQTVSNCKKASVEDVIKAYREYVSLYEYQASLASSFNTLAIEEAQARGETFESQYSKLGRILNEPTLALVVRNLFKAIQAGDYELEQLDTNQHLVAKIGRALREIVC